MSWKDLLRMQSDISYIILELQIPLWFIWSSCSWCGHCLFMLSQLFPSLTETVPTDESNNEHQHWRHNCYTWHRYQCWNIIWIRLSCMLKEVYLPIMSIVILLILKQITFSLGLWCFQFPFPILQACCCIGSSNKKSWTTLTFLCHWIIYVEYIEWIVVTYNSWNWNKTSMQ